MIICYQKWLQKSNKNDMLLKNVNMIPKMGTN